MARLRVRATARFRVLALLLPWLLAAGVAARCSDDGAPPAVAACREGDAIRVDAADQEQPGRVLALFHGWREGYCSRDSVCVGPPGLALAALPETACTPNELAAFAPRSAPDAVADCPGEPGDAQRCEGRSVLKLRRPETIAVAVWVVAPEAALTDETTLAIHELEHANRAFDSTGTGVVLSYTVEGLAEGSQRDSARIAHIGSGCNGASGVRTDLTVFHAGAVNVYYLSVLTDGTADIGAACWPNHPDAVYVSRAARRPALLAHEVGHALGLMTPESMSGHVEQLPEFAQHQSDPEFRNNLMNGRVETVESVWLGQIYRIHSDQTYSWLQRHPRTDVPSAPGRPCQDGVTSDGPCPAVTLRVRGWL